MELQSLMGYSLVNWTYTEFFNETENNSSATLAAVPNLTKLYGNDTNATIGPTEWKSPYDTHEIVMLSIVAGILSVMTFGGNIMVMISFKLDPQLQTVSNYFLLSLAVADVAIGAISMPLYTVYILLNRWIFSDLVCDTWLAVDYTMSNASVLNLLVISFDRYFSVTRPLTYRAKRTPKRAAIMISSAWIISILLWTPWIIAWPLIEKRQVEPGQCYVQFLDTNPTVTIATALAAFYFPVIGMSTLYWRIFLETKKRQRELAALQGSEGGGRSDSRKSAVSSDSETAEDMPGTSANAQALQVLTMEEGDRSRLPLWKRILCCRFHITLPIDKDNDDFYDAEDSTSDATPGSPMACTESAATSTVAAAGTCNSSLRHNTLNHSIPLINVQDNSSRLRSLGSSGSSSGGTVGHADVGGGGGTSKDMYTIVIQLPDQAKQPAGKASITMLADDSESEWDMQSEHQALRSPGGDSDAPLQRTMAIGSCNSIVQAAAGNNTSAQQGHDSSSTNKLASVKAKSQRTKKKRSERKQDKKAAKTLTAILLAFVVTWTPYNIFVLVKAFCKEECVPDPLYNFSYYLCYINSTINPMCYALCNINFRKTFKRILLCRWKERKNYITVNRAGYVQR